VNEGVKIYQHEKWKIYWNLMCILLVHQL